MSPQATRRCSAPMTLGAGLSARILDPTSEQWKMVWRLWAKYYVLGPPAYESARASVTEVPEVRNYGSALSRMQVRFDAKVVDKQMPSPNPANESILYQPDEKAESSGVFRAWFPKRGRQT